MNFAFRKYSWLVWLLIGCLAISGAWADGWDDDEDDYMEDEDAGAWYVGSGKAVTKDLAVKQAQVAAMLRFVKENIDAGDFNLKKNDIKRFLEKGNNYENYVKNTRRVGRKFRPFNAYRVRVLIDDEQLLADIKQFTEKARTKAMDYKVVLCVEKDDRAKRDKNEWLDIDVLFDTVQAHIGRQLEIYSIKDLHEFMKKEAELLGMSPSSDPESFLAKKFNEYNIGIYLWVKTEGKKNPYFSDREWHATIGARAVHIQGGRELFKFQLDSVKLTKVAKVKGFGPVRANSEAGISDRMARSQAIEKVATYVAKKMMFEIANVKIALPENEYRLVFSNFAGGEQRSTIKMSLLALSSGKGRDRFATLVGGNNLGPSQFEFRVKWLRSGMAQQMVEEIVKNTLQSNGVPCQVTKSSKGIIYFEPAEAETDDFGGF